MFSCAPSDGGLYSDVVSAQEKILILMIDPSQEKIFKYEGQLVFHNNCSKKDKLLPRSSRED